MLALLRFPQVKRADVGNPDLIGPPPIQATPVPGVGVPPITESSKLTTDAANRTTAFKKSPLATPPKLPTQKMPAPGAATAFQPSSPKPQPAKTSELSARAGLLALEPLKSAFSILPGPPHMTATEKLKGVGQGALDELGNRIEAMETQPIPMLIPQQQREQSPTMVNQHPAQA